jgi:hypothetical protein
VVGGSSEHDPFAEQVEVGAAAHLVFDHFDAIDVSFDGSGVVGEGKAVANGVVVTVDPNDERLQVRLVVGPDAAPPPSRTTSQDSQEQASQLRWLAGRHVSR